MKAKIAFVLLFITTFSWGQVLLPNNTAVTQDFTSLGNSATATLPTGFKFGIPTGVTPNFTSDYTLVANTTSTTRRYGTTGAEVVNGTSVGAAVNWANGIAASSTDRSIGILSSSTYTSPRVIMMEIQNTGADIITDLSISFDYEKYRSGTRAFNLLFFHGATATAISTNDANGNQAYAADANNTTVFNPPTAIAKTINLSGLSICPGQNYYFAWVYAGVAGSTNAQGIGLDNVVVQSTARTALSCLVPANPGAITFGAVGTTTIAASFVGPVAAGKNFLVVRSTASTLSATPVNGVSYTIGSAFGGGTVVDTDANLAINDSGLTEGTQYYYFVYAMSTGCTCGPYYSAGFSTNTTYTVPLGPANFTRGCSTNTTQELSWAPPASGGFDGYLLVARQGGNPSVVTGLNPPSTSFNADFSIANIYNGTTTSKVLYVGTGTNITVTGLTPGLSYTYYLYAYKYGSPTLKRYSTIATATTITQVTGLTNVSALNANSGNTTGTITWTNPTIGCFDQVMAVVTSAAGITFTPFGNGGIYTANSAFSAFNQVVYKGTGNVISITGLTNGVTYYVEIFVRKGTEWSSGVEISVTPTNATVFRPGDLVLIAYNNNISSGNDAFRMLTFVPVTTGTKFIWANAVYETGGRPAANVRTDLWYTATTAPTGDVPYLEFTYTGATTIPAGSVFCVVTDNAGTAATSIIAYSNTGVNFPFTDFSVVGKTALGTILGTHSSVNVSTSAPDSMFLMQGNFSYNATGSSFFGQVLYGVQDGGAWYELTDNLSAVSGNDYRRSRKHPALLCSSLQANLTTGTFSREYTSITTGTQPALLISTLNFASNWTAGYGSCPNPSPFTITASDPFNKWLGTTSTNWFDCTNWADRSVPNETVNVLVDATASRDAVIDFNATYSDVFLDIAQAKNLTINGRKVVAAGNSANKLEVYGNLIIGALGELDMSDGVAGTPDGQLYLFGDWTNNGTETSFKQGESTVHFLGSSPQLINTIPPFGTEVFYNLLMNNDFSTSVSNNLLVQGDLTVSLGKTMTVDVNDYIQVNNKLEVNGDLVIENNAQLIQVNETDSNVGTNVVVKRVATINRGDYVYWSSPVENFNVTSIPGFLRYYWSPDGINANGTYGNWLVANSLMNRGQGYIVRAPNSYPLRPVLPQTLPVAFSGKPYNGQFTVPISRRTPDTPSINDNFNLLGNPYPSAIDADLFLAENLGNIEGYIDIWTHGFGLSTSNPDPFYQNFYSNYSAADNYLTYNGTATSTPAVFNGKIASGQGFFVQMKESGLANQAVTFKNEMRSDVINGYFYNNNEFFRSSTITAGVVKHRIWLDFSNASNDTKRAVIGYVTNATVEKDWLYDAKAKPNETIRIYSIIGDEAMHIQGRPVPFNEQDQVALGMDVNATGIYTISINTVDGLFAQSQPIYLEDLELNTIHDLRATPYQVTLTSGSHTNRFVLRYTNETLGTPTYNTLSGQVLAYGLNNVIHLKSTVENINSIEVYDVLGRLLLEKKTSEQELELPLQGHANQPILVKVTLANGQIVTRKIVL
jgi:hypothetical protein